MLIWLMRLMHISSLSGWQKGPLSPKEKVRPFALKRENSEILSDCFCECSVAWHWIEANKELLHKICRQTQDLSALGQHCALIT